MLKRAIIVILVVAVALIAVLLLIPTKTAPKQPDPPCEELVWMRDSPQARCVEYWKQRNIEEAKQDAEFYAQ